MKELLLLATGITMGFGPCLLLWGPFLLPYIAAEKRNWYDGLRLSILFSLGRLLALTILGIIAYFAFATINRFFPPHKSGYLYILISVFIILIGIAVIFGKGFKSPFYQAFRKPIKGIIAIFVLGFLLGIAPCAPLVAILSYIACTATNVVQSIAYALCFGFGTIIPVVALATLTGFLSGKIFKITYLKPIRIICGTIIIAFGIYLFYNTLSLF